MNGRFDAMQKGPPRAMLAAGDKVQPEGWKETLSRLVPFYKVQGRATAFFFLLNNANEGSTFHWSRDNFKVIEPNLIHVVMPLAWGRSAWPTARPRLLHEAIQLASHLA